MTPTQNAVNLWTMELPLPTAFGASVVIDLLKEPTSAVLVVVVVSVLASLNMLFDLGQVSSISMDKIGNRGKCQATVLKYGEFLQKDLSRDKLPRCVGI